MNESIYVHHYRCKINNDESSCNRLTDTHGSYGIKMCFTLFSVMSHEDQAPYYTYVHNKLTDVLFLIDDDMKLM